MTPCCGSHGAVDLFSGRLRRGRARENGFTKAMIRASLKAVSMQRLKIRDLLAEVLNLIFVKYRKPEIAPLYTGMLTKGWGKWPFLLKQTPS